MLDKLSSLLNEAFDSNIIIDTYSPFANIPIGANNAQTAIIFASSINDRSSLESLLGRILKRTAPVAGGKAGMPPSHVVLISSLGTERTNKMPYSMSNLFGLRVFNLLGTAGTDKGPAPCGDWPIGGGNLGGRHLDRL